MTKVELIRKLAKKAGVPDSEAKIFFEIFLQHIGSQLSPGEAINIKNFGFFQLRKGKIKSAGEQQESESLFPDLIVYTPHENTAADSDESLIFNIPVSKPIEYNPIDSHFSLSFGKPVIPLRGVRESEFFLQPTGNELRRLIESKVENLIEHAGLIKNYTKGNEYILISADVLKTHQFEFSWNEASNKPDADIQSSIAENIPWDFGEDISKQIEEESILDVEREDEQKNITWDFGIIDEPDDEERTTTPQREDETKKPNVENLKNFKRVNSFTSEHQKPKGGYITRSEEDLTWNFGVPSEDESNRRINASTRTDIFSRYDEPLQSKNEFVEVKNKRKTYEHELTEEEQQQLDYTIRQEEQKQETFIHPEPEEQKEKTFSSHTSIDRNYYSGRKSTPVFFIALFVIVFVGAALFIYLRDGGLLKKKNSKPVEVKQSVALNIIERTYDIPVTFPYTKTGEVVQQKSIETENNVAKTVISKNSSGEIVYQSGVQSEKIKDNLFKEGETFSVQVSAWRTRSKAAGEAEKLIKRGLNAAVETVVVSGKTWYRVKIIKLKSQSEAEKYLTN